MRIVRTEAVHRERASYGALRHAWPELVRHDPVANEHWHRLFDEFAEFQFVAVEDGEVLAEGCAIPVRGLPAGWRQAFLSEGEPDRLCALQVLIAPENHGRGLSRPMLEHMRGRYARWLREDGLLFDPWLRTHERLGATVVGSAPEAMRISGRVCDWQDWTGMVFPDSGSYVVPGALAPVEVDVERDEGLYVEPCVWMRHRA